MPLLPHYLRVDPFLIDALPADAANSTLPSALPFRWDVAPTTPYLFDTLQLTPFTGRVPPLFCVGLPCPALPTHTFVTFFSYVGTITVRPLLPHVVDVIYLTPTIVEFTVLFERACPVAVTVDV